MNPGQNEPAAFEQFANHSNVLVQHVGNEPMDPASFRCEQHLLGDRRPDALALPIIVDHQPKRPRCRHQPRRSCSDLRLQRYLVNPFLQAASIVAGRPRW
jgi:hypothetical protein